MPEGRDGHLHRGGARPVSDAGGEAGPGDGGGPGPVPDPDLYGAVPAGRVRRNAALLRPGRGGPVHGAGRAAGPAGGAGVPDAAEERGRAAAGGEGRAPDHRHRPERHLPPVRQLLHRRESPQRLRHAGVRAPAGGHPEGGGGGGHRRGLSEGMEHGPARVPPSGADAGAAALRGGRGHDAGGIPEKPGAGGRAGVPAQQVCPVPGIHEAAGGAAAPPGGGSLHGEDGRGADGERAAQRPGGGPRYYRGGDGVPVPASGF